MNDKELNEICDLFTKNVLEEDWDEYIDKGGVGFQNLIKNIKQLGSEAHDTFIKPVAKFIGLSSDSGGDNEGKPATPTHTTPAPTQPQQSEQDRIRARRKQEMANLVKNPPQSQSEQDRIRARRKQEMANLVKNQQDNTTVQTAQRNEQQMRKMHGLLGGGGNNPEQPVKPQQPSVLAQARQRVTNFIQNHPSSLAATAGLAAGAGAGYLGRKLSSKK